MLRRFRPLHALLVAATVLGIASSAACTPTKPPPLRVEVWGDSIAGQASSYIGFYLGLSGKVTPRIHTYPGTAMCDWFADMRSELNPANPTGFHPQAVVIQFSGDAFTPCMKNAAGVPYSGQALVNKYQFDSAGVIGMFTRAHVPVYFVSTPISRAQAAQGDVGNAPVGVLFSKLPKIYPQGGLTRFIDGAAAVEWQGHYSDTLPCAPWETCTGHWPDGTKTVVVREADGVHFCPVKEVPIAGGGGLTQCPVYMGGAARFALAIAGPVLHDFHLS
jgi:hypothetical protein